MTKYHVIEPLRHGSDSGVIDYAPGAIVDFKAEVGDGLVAQGILMSPAAFKALGNETAEAAVAVVDGAQG